jgi:hypothetical protein
MNKVNWNNFSSEMIKQQVAIVDAKNELIDRGLMTCTDGPHCAANYTHIETRLIGNRKILTFKDKEGQPHYFSIKI